MSGNVRMIAVRRVAAIATDLTCRVVGRCTVVRTARFVLSHARLSRAGEQIHVAGVGPTSAGGRNHAGRCGEGRPRDGSMAACLRARLQDLRRLAAALDGT